MKVTTVSMLHQFVEGFVEWLNEHDIKHYEPFEIDGLWKVPCIPLGKEQKQLFAEYMEYRCNNDLL